MTYKIVIGDGKYTVINNNGVMAIWRYNNPWRSEYQYSGFVLALVQRIEEIEKANVQLLEATKVGLAELEHLDNETTEVLLIRSAIAVAEAKP